jgi:hypothetical protein
MSPPRRATDRKGWPLRDRVRYQIYRLGRLLYVVVPIVLVVYIVLADSKNTNRDEARKYQRCTQTVSQANAQNTTNRILRSALLTTRGRLLLQAKRTDDTVLKRRYVENARRFLKDREAITLAAIPDCRKTYPRGFEHSDDFPDLAPAAPPKASR